MIAVLYIGDVMISMIGGDLDSLNEGVYPYSFANKKIYFNKSHNKVLPMFSIQAF